MTDNSAPLYCANHPSVETSLRCNRCGKPICAKCAVRTPTGYRCKECVRGQQKIFNTAQPADYVLGFVVAALLSLIASLLVSLIGGIAGFFGWFLIIIGAPSAAMVIAEAARFVTHRHRARSLFLTVAAGVVLGVIPAVLWHLVSLNLYSLLFQGIYLFVATPVVFTRLSGIQLNK